MKKSEDISQRGFDYAREQLDAVLNQTEDYVREKPAQALLYAFVAGFIVNRLPIGRIMSGGIRLLLFAFKPAVLVYGATKLYHAAEADE